MTDIRHTGLTALACAAALTLAPAAHGGTANTAETPAFANAVTLTSQSIRDIFLTDPFGLERFLGFQAGVSFHSTGDFGAEDWIMIRGFGRDDSRIILVLVDGRPINMRTNTVDFGDVILGSIETMTIYPGPVPARFGGYHAVIDITTRRNENYSFASASAGSQSSYGASAGFLRSSGNVYFGGEFELRTSDAASNQTYQYQLRATPPVPASGRACVNLPFPPGFCAPTPIDEITFSEREDRLFVAQLHAGAIISDNLDVTARLSHVHSRKSLGSDLWIPARYAPASLDPANQRPQIDARNRDFTSVSLSARPAPGSDQQFAATAWYTHEEEELGTLGKQYYLGRQTRSRYGANAHYRQPLSQWAGLTVGGEFVHVDGSVANPNEVAFPWGIYDLVSSQSYYGAFADFDLTPWDGGRITAGVRLNGQSDTSPSNELNPVVSFEQSLMDGMLSAFAVYGENNRWMPPLELERYSAGGFSVPMETMKGFEIGARARLLEDRALMRVSYFQLENTFNAGPAAPRRDTGESRGVEATLDAALHERVRLAVNLTRFNTPRGDVQSPGDYRWLANAGLFVQASDTLRLEAVVRHMSAFRTGFEDLSEFEALFTQLQGPPFFLQFPGFDGYGAFRQGAVTVADASVTWRLPVEPRASFTLGVYNLTDVRYNTFPELPQWDLPNQMPGRQVHANLSVSF